MFVSRGRSSRSPRVLSSASTKLQRVVLVTVATFLSLAGLAGACVFLILRFRGLIKYWFHSPPGIPAQIEEVRAHRWEADGWGRPGTEMREEVQALYRVPAAYSQ